MEIPKTIKIGGHQYKIVFPYHFTESFDKVGDHDSSVKVIRLSDLDANIPIAESGIVVSLIHEILHAIDENSGYDMFVSEEGEKRIVAISEGIYQVLVDNHKLIKVLSK